MIKTLLTLILILLGNFLFAQSNYKVSHSDSRNPEKLSQHLTSNLNTDSEKVFAIHYWITHHIKYNIKKYFNYDFETQPIRKILRNRKAICTGYCDLFNTLCSYCHIESVTIPGYVKDPYVDLKDKFYLDEHAWSAVKVNNKWRLVDATWDAGYIKFTKVTLFSKLVHSVTFGKTKLTIRYKPYFVQHPILNYYNRTGKLFKTDHMPTNPIWQLLPSEMSIEDFEKDSSFYFFKYDLSTDNASYSENDDKRENYYNKEGNENSFAQGVITHLFNPKNNFLIAQNYSQIATRVADTIDFSANYNLRKQLRDCDSALKYIDTAIYFYKLNDSLLHLQQNNLLDNNLKKQTLFNNCHRRVVAAERKTLRVVKNNFPTLKSANYLVSTNIRVNNQRMRIITHLHPVRPRALNRAEATKDSIKLAIQILHNDDSIAFLKALINKQVSKTDSIYNDIVNRIKLYQARQTGLDDTEGILIGARMEFFDDFDFPVISIRDKFVAHQLKNDSLLSYHDSSVYKAFFYRIKYNLNLYRRLYLCYRQNVVCYNKIKAVEFDYKKGDTLHLKSIHLTLQQIKLANDFDKIVLGYLFSLNNYNFDNLVSCKGDFNQLNFELNLENSNRANREQHIRNRASAYMKLNTASESPLLKLQKSVLQRKENLQSMLKSVEGSQHK